MDQCYPPKYCPKMNKKPESSLKCREKRKFFSVKFSCKIREPRHLRYDFDILRTVFIISRSNCAFGGDSTLVALASSYLYISKSAPDYREDEWDYFPGARETFFRNCSWFFVLKGSERCFIPGPCNWLVRHCDIYIHIYDTLKVCFSPERVLCVLYQSLRSLLQSNGTQAMPIQNIFKHSHESVR